MNGLIRPTGAGRFWPGDLALSAGLASLVISPYFLEKVKGDGYFAFDILESFLIPHMQALGVSTVVIFLVISICRFYDLKSRSLMTLTGALFLIFVFRGFLSSMGITPQNLAAKTHEWLTFLGHGRPDVIFLRRSGVFVLFGLGLVLLHLVVRDKRPLFRACAAFGWALGAITIVRAAPMVMAEMEDSAVRHEITRSNLPATPVERRVVWVIFDEFDYNRFFRNRNPKLALPNVDRLQHEGVSATDAVSPAWTTAISIPALTTGTPVSAVESAGAGRLMLKVQNDVDVEWGKASTVFSRLKNEGKKSSILGFYHPYCSIFPYVDPCLSQPVFSYQVWWWGIWQGLRAVPGVDVLARKYKWTNEGFNQATRLQLDELGKHLSAKSIALSFIHFDIPHLPGGRVHGAELTRETEALPGYDQNALTVDWAVGQVVESLEAQSRSQDILLIVSSDHWLRTRLNSATLSPDQIRWEFGADTTEAHTIPLLIRRMRETSEYVISKPLSTVHTAQLVEDFLAGRVIDHAGIAAWWRKKPYIEPVVTEKTQVM